jgi:iron complex transport system ATP-binding protein
MSALIEARNVGFTYRGGQTALRDVSLSIAPESMTALIGANGSGKSTLIRILAGLLAPAAGEVSLRGRVLAAWDGRARAREIGYVPQAANVVFPFTAIEVVLSGRMPYLRPLRFESTADYAKAIEALEAVGADHLAHRSVTALSGGERQLVMLARALAQEPSMLLLDEPSAALDLKHRAALMRTLARLRTASRLAVVMVTHDLQLAGASCDRIVALHEGAVAADGGPDDVLESRLLARVFGDSGVRTVRIDSQILVWTSL